MGTRSFYGNYDSSGTERDMHTRKISRCQHVPLGNPVEFTFMWTVTVFRKLNNVIVLVDINVFTYRLTATFLKIFADNVGRL